MNTRTKTLIVCSPVMVALMLTVQAAESDFKNDQDKLSYAVGMNVAQMLKAQGVSVDTTWAVRGLQDALNEKGMKLTPDEARILLNRYRSDLEAKKREKTRAIMAKNSAEGTAFLATNKNNPGVITLPSGLQYKILHEGSGTPPKREDLVKINYRGTLLDGTEIESSALFKSTPMYAVNGVIPGWTEALVLMKPGSQWRLFIPSGLAYQDYGRDPLIGPMATLIYDLELVSVEKPLAATPQVTSDVIMVPSFQDLQKGAKVTTIKSDEVQRLEKQYMEDQLKKQSNAAKSKTP